MPKTVVQTPGDDQPRRNANQSRDAPPGARQSWDVCRLHAQDRQGRSPRCAAELGRVQGKPEGARRPRSWGWESPRDQRPTEGEDPTTTPEPSTPATQGVLPKEVRRRRGPRPYFATVQKVTASHGCQELTPPQVMDTGQGRSPWCSAELGRVPERQGRSPRCKQSRDVCPRQGRSPGCNAELGRVPKAGTLPQVQAEPGRVPV